MKYRSTRGEENGLSFEYVLLAGYASDKGLYMPESIPKLSQKELVCWASLTYSQLVYEVARKYISSQELSDFDLKRIIEASFVRFSNPELINVKHLPTVSIVELFYGPTLAFKDIPLAVVGGLLSYFTSRKNQRIISLVGTSGDTGGAAIESVRGLENIDIIVLYPKYRVTAVQELQMTTVRDNNVHVYAVDGTSDDLDVPIKRCFADRKLVKKHHLTSMNSFNWARIMAQIPMYFYAYYKIALEVGENVEMIVPTGAAGNVTAGCLARKMGLPIRLVAAVNDNDIVARALQGGNFATAEVVRPTHSSAMDIQIPYNMERLLFLFSDCDATYVQRCMKEFDDKGETQIPSNLLTEIRRAITDSYVASDSEVINSIRRTKQEFNYILCPHTAVGMAYHFQRPSSTKRGLMATASPSKFPATIEAAGEVPPKDGIEELFGRSTGEAYLLTKDQDWFAFLKNKIVGISEGHD